MQLDKSQQIILKNHECNANTAAIETITKIMDFNENHNTDTK